MSIPRTLILMGVCGCGKTLTGQMLAQKFGGVFEDADDFHPAPNKAKMTAGIPLTDEDRWPWLHLLRERIIGMRSATPCYLLACSALKQAYRDILRGDDPRGVLEFIHLKGSRELIGARMAARKGHYMPPTLLDSQFAILEEPQDAITIGISGMPEEIVADVLAQLDGPAWHVDTASATHTLSHEQAAPSTSSKRRSHAASFGEAAEALAGTGTGAGERVAKVQADCLVTWAKATGCLIGDDEFGALRLIRDDTAEHEVRFRDCDQRAVKKTWPGTFGMIPEWSPVGWHHASATPLEYIHRFEMQNHIFGDDARLEGVMVTAEPASLVGAVPGGCSLVMSQDWFLAANPLIPHPDEAEVDAFMRERLFEPLLRCPFGWLRASDGVLVMDAKPDNFIKASKGIVPFDLTLARGIER